MHAEEGEWLGLLVGGGGARLHARRGQRRRHLQGEDGRYGRGDLFLDLEEQVLDALVSGLGVPHKSERGDGVGQEAVGLDDGPEDAPGHDEEDERDGHAHEQHQVQVEEAFEHNAPELVVVLVERVEDEELKVPEEEPVEADPKHHPVLQGHVHVQECRGRFPESVRGEGGVDGGGGRQNLLLPKHREDKRVRNHPQDEAVHEHLDEAKEIKHGLVGRGHGLALRHLVHRHAKDVVEGLLIHANIE
mmetsp:Transcript_56773/g.179499  ORF Transcript_56773/g.179499 Transcript_56773/m.179499 type:complete len:246 (+) Transcript_56773:569-1306(+)